MSNKSKPTKPKKKGFFAALDEVLGISKEKDNVVSKPTTSHQLSETSFSSLYPSGFTVQKVDQVLPFGSAIILDTFRVAQSLQFLNRHLRLRQL
eukprot:m.385579 g.385579  ORF g.385579 m.385579 type:complete len:94 (+) comp16740_c0_seq2:50-331(+)